MFKKLVLFLLSSLIVFAVTLFVRLGGFKDVSLKIEDRGDIFLIYKEHFGAYHKINDVIVEVETYAVKNNIPCALTFGEYRDDPRQVDERRLRSRGGCILKNELPAAAVQSLPNGILAMKIPARKWLVGFFEGAPSISPFKVYPKAEEYMKFNNFKQDGAVIEIYSVIARDVAKTEYLFPIAP